MRALSLTVLTAALAAIPASAAEWDWNVTPYVWATSVGVSASVDDRQLIDKTISVGDLAEHVDATFQLHAEGQRGKHGLFMDAFYVFLQDADRQVAVPTYPGAMATLDANFEMTIFELGGLYNFNGDGSGFSLLYGTRILDEQVGIDATYALDRTTSIDRSYDTGDTYYDALFGVRYVKRFGRHWSTSLRADASAGGTRLTWNVNSLLTYAFGREGRYALTTGYRKMAVDFKEDHSVSSDMTLSGPVVGFRMTF